MVSRSPRARCAAVGHAAAGRRDVGGEHRFFQCRRRVARQPVGAHAGEQFVEHHAERVDVGGHAHRPRAHLLGRGVVGGYCAAHQPGDLGLRRAIVAEQLGHAEVEQPHLAGRGDEDVARLEVAVHDEPAVRVRHRLGHLQDEAQPRVDRQAALAAMHVDRHAVDELHRQPGPALGGDAGVVQPRDARVLERGEDVALARHALREAGGPAGVRELERLLAVQAAVGALGQPHRGHAAVAELAQQPVGADAVAGRIGFDARFIEAVDRQRLAQEVVAGIGAGALEQLAQQRQQIAVGFLQALQPGLALRRRQRERGFEQRIQAPQLAGILRRLHRLSGRASAPAAAGRAPSRAAPCGRRRRAQRRSRRR